MPLHVTDVPAVLERREPIDRPTRLGVASKSPCSAIAERTTRPRREARLERRAAVARSDAPAASTERRSRRAASRAARSAPTRHAELEAGYAVSAYTTRFTAKRVLSTDRKRLLSG